MPRRPAICTGPSRCRYRSRHDVRVDATERTLADLRAALDSFRETGDVSGPGTSVLDVHLRTAQRLADRGLTGPAVVNSSISSTDWTRRLPGAGSPARPIDDCDTRRAR